MLGEDIEYQPTIELEKSHPVSRMKNLRERVSMIQFRKEVWATKLDSRQWDNHSGHRFSMSNGICHPTAYPQPCLLLSKVNGCIIQRPCPARHWPQRLELSQRKTFKQWKVTPENEQTTSVCESIIDHLGERHNPHIIIGASEVGKVTCSMQLDRAPCGISMVMFASFVPPN